MQSVHYFTQAPEPPTPKGEYILGKFKILLFNLKGKILGYQQCTPLLGSGVGRSEHNTALNAPKSMALG